MISQSVIIAMYVNIFISMFLPIVLFIFFKRKLNVSIKVFLVGMLTFFLFAVVLEGIVHSLVVTKSLVEKPFAYMLYGGFMAGIFEEVGRYVMLAYMLKKYRDWKDGLTLGLGHGSFEAMLVSGLNMVVLLAIATMMNAGDVAQYINTPEAIAYFAPLEKALLSLTPVTTILGGVERIAALAIQMGLSILVLYSITSKRKIFLVYAIIIHAIIDFPAGLYQTGVITNIYVLEGIIILFAILSVMWIVKSRQLFTETGERKNGNPKVTS